MPPSCSSLPALLYSGHVASPTIMVPHLLSSLVLPLSQPRTSPSSQSLAPSPKRNASVKLRLKLQLHRLPSSVVRDAESSPVIVPYRPNGKKAPEDHLDKAKQAKKRARKQALSDFHCVPRSQSSAEHTPRSALTSLTNGFVHRPVREAAHKIRVDFKVCGFISSFFGTFF